MYLKNPPVVALSLMVNIFSSHSFYAFSPLTEENNKIHENFYVVLFLCCSMLMMIECGG